MTENIKNEIDSFINKLYKDKTESEKVELGAYLLKQTFNREGLITFQELSDNGLIWRINKEVLHPLGLALTRDPDLNVSFGCIEDVEPFYYSDESNKNNRQKWVKSKYNRLNK